MSVSADFAWDDLHDATLLAIQIEWESGIATMQFRSTSGTVTLRVQPFSFLSVPRLCPWGASVSINQVQCTVQNADYQLVIEMQSGDTIVIQGTEFQIIRD